LSIELPDDGERNEAIQRPDELRIFIQPRLRRDGA
jgi:hypothetical protein